MDIKANPLPNAQHTLAGISDLGWDRGYTVAGKKFWSTVNCIDEVYETVI